jgi:hypothetical protein
MSEAERDAVASMIAGEASTSAGEDGPFVWDVENEHPATIGLVNGAVEELIGLVETSHDKLKEGFSELNNARRQEHADLKVTIAELRSEVIALRAIVEAQRERSRGERGEKGSRGVPGRDGATGSKGERGLQGQRGEKAVSIASWIINDAAFTATPVLTSGDTGPTLSLRPFFERYDALVDTDAALDAQEADDHARRTLAIETERSRWAR